MAFLKSVLVLSSVVALLAIAATVLIPSAQLEKLLRDYLPQEIAGMLASLLKTDSSSSRGPVFSKKELQKYTGEPGSPGLYLAILGKDGTRAFITGEFNDEGLIEDVTGLSNAQLVELEEWLNFYKKDYIYKGFLDGHYYDSLGNPKPTLQKVYEGIKLGKADKEKQKEDERKFPSCNSEWSQASGGRVWCSDRSGGIQRDWAGVPRMYHKPGQKSTRCACIRTKGPPTDQPESKSNRGDLDNPNFKLYPNCDELSVSCKLPDK